MSQKGGNETVLGSAHFKCSSMGECDTYLELDEVYWAWLIKWAIKKSSEWIIKWLVLTNLVTKLPTWHFLLFLSYLQFCLLSFVFLSYLLFPLKCFTQSSVFYLFLHSLYLCLFSYKLVCLFSLIPLIDIFKKSTLSNFGLKTF